MIKGHWSGSADDFDPDRNAPAAGIMIIRTWWDPVHPQGFRARISYGQAPGIDQTIVATANPAEILEVVKRWLATQPGVSGRN